MPVLRVQLTRANLSELRECARRCGAPSIGNFLLDSGLARAVEVREAAKILEARPVRHDSRVRIPGR